MKIEKVALSVYLISSFLAVVASILDYDFLMLMTKPVVVPAIFFYYLSIKKQKIDLFFSLVLLLNFIGDCIVLLELENGTLLIMIPYFLSYLIMLKFSVEDVRKVNFNKWGLGLSVFVFCFLMYLMYILIQLFMDTNEELVVPVLLYGITLGTYGSMAAYCYYCENTTVAFFMLMAALFSTVSDVFYVLFSLIFHFPSFYYFEFFAQLVSYFLMVKYFVLREKQENHLVTI